LTKLEKDTPKNSNIAQQIFEDLQRHILSGQLSAGERLLGERELAAKYGTNRNTLREAVRKLEQARLVSVRHGRGVTVADFRRTGTPELLAPYLRAGPDMSEVADIIGDVLEPRILLLEYAGIAYTGSPPLALSLALHKHKAKDVLRAAGVPTPEGLAVARTQGKTYEILVVLDGLKNKAMRWTVKRP